MHRNFIATPYLLELMLYIKALFPSHLFKTTFMTKGLRLFIQNIKIFNCINFQQQQKQDKYIRPYKKKFLFPVPAPITFQGRIKKILIFYLIEFDLFGFRTNCFSMKANSLLK